MIDSLVGAGPFGNTSVSSLAARIRKHETTALELVEEALAAAHKYGGKLNCFVTIDDEGARRAAQLADRELTSGFDRGPLHGIPVGIKDNISTSGLVTTMGSRHFSDFVPAADARVVTSLRRTGAVVLAKTQTHEFAYGTTSDRSASGPALNPHDPSLVTGGSSGGSAAAVAAGLVPIALGTDTGGSVRIPAALCGTVGMRPSQYALNTEGVFPLSPTMDTVGSLTANVTDAAITWWALSSGPDADGVGWPEWSQHVQPDPAGFENLRVGWVDCSLVERTSIELTAAAQIAIDGLTRRGASVSRLPVPEVDKCAEPYQIIQSVEASALHKRRIDHLPELFDSEVLDLLRAASKVQGWRYVQALETRRKLQMDTLRRTSSVDILLMPTVPIAAPALGQRELQSEFGWTNCRQALLAMTSPWSVLGFPSISIPVVSGPGLPQSVQLIAKPHQEQQLLEAATMLEASLEACER